jgi:hypothetical protein
MYVDVLWILISDRGSTPRTSTRLRFERSEKRSLQRRSKFIYEAVHYMTIKFAQNYALVNLEGK